jgi:hypothetical protein
MRDKLKFYSKMAVCLVPLTAVMLTSMVIVTVYMLAVNYKVEEYESLS